MYVRLVRFTFGPGKHSEAQGLATDLVPAISNQKGCEAVAFFGDEVDGEYGISILWETKEDDAAASLIIRPSLQAGLTGKAQGSPDIRLFDVMETS